MAKPELTEKEKKAIEALQALAKEWPRTLLLGGDGEESRVFTIWKPSEPGVHVQVGKIRGIGNMDSW